MSEPLNKRHPKHSHFSTTILMKSQQEILSQRPSKPKRCDSLKINSLGNTKRRLHEQIMIGRTRRHSLRFPPQDETFFHLCPTDVVNEKEKYCPFLFLNRYMAQKNIRELLDFVGWIFQVHMQILATVAFASVDYEKSVFVLGILLLVAPAVLIFLFKSVSHQVYQTADLHLEIRMAGIERTIQNIMFPVWWIILAKITHSKCQKQERGVSIIIQACSLQFF